MTLIPSLFPSYNISLSGCELKNCLTSGRAYAVITAYDWSLITLALVTWYCDLSVPWGLIYIYVLREHMYYCNAAHLHHCGDINLHHCGALLAPQRTTASFILALGTMNWPFVYAARDAKCCAKTDYLILWGCSSCMQVSIPDPRQCVFRATHLHACHLTIVSMQSMCPYRTYMGCQPHKQTA